MKRLCLCVLFLIGVLGILPAQTYVSVDLDDPVYRLLDNADQRGLLPILPTARPYTRDYVARLLNELQTRRSRLSPSEQQSLDFHIQRFAQHQRSFIRADQGKGSFEVGFEAQGDTRINANNPQGWHTYNGLQFYFTGDLFGALSYYGAAGGTLDKVGPDAFYRNLTYRPDYRDNPSGAAYDIRNYWYLGVDDMTQAISPTNQAYFQSGHNDASTWPGSFAPYQFTSQWDGIHTSIRSLPHHHDGVWPSPSFALSTEGELTASFYEGDVYLRFAKIRREWGAGDGSLSLSRTARPFTGLETHIEPVSWFRFSFTAGSLGNPFTDAYLDSSSLDNADSDPVAAYENLFDDTISEQRMYTLQQFQFIPLPWLSLSISSSAIWYKRFELTYLFPYLVPMFSQNLNGDMDNVDIGIGIDVRIPYVGKAYANFFLDETQGSSLSDFFSYSRNLYAWQAGLQSPIPVLPFATLTFQYTKVNPFVYSHYVEADAANSQYPVSMNYTHDGENLGYFLPPNADEFLLKLETFPLPELMVSLKYQLIRHGTNVPYDSDDDGIPDGRIYGDIYIPLDYDQSDIPYKDFLNDGVYDWTNSVTLEARYDFSNLPLSVGFLYLFSYTFWDTNGIDVTVPEAFFQNVFGLSFKVFH